MNFPGNQMGDGFSWESNGMILIFIKSVDNLLCLTLHLWFGWNEFQFMAMDTANTHVVCYYPENYAFKLSWVISMATTIFKIYVHDILISCENYACSSVWRLNYYFQKKKGFNMEIYENWKIEKMVRLKIWLVLQP